MLIVIQLILFCLLFTFMVKLTTIGGAINAVYFYPKAVQERVIKLGLTDKDTIKKKKLIFVVVFYIVLLTALLLIIGLWNGVSDFGTAYWQALLFLEVMNWYDGIVIDKVWVGHSKLWVIKGAEDIPYIRTWKQVLKKRGILTLIWFAGAAAVAGLVALFF